MVNFYDEYYTEEEEENYLAEKMASEELKEIYDLLSKNWNTKTKNELEYLRKRNAELEKEVIELSKYKRDSDNIRAELEAEYREKEKNLYKRPITELVGLLNKEYFKIRCHDIYADCPHCKNTRKLTFTDPFGKDHSWQCECVKTIARKEYYLQSNYVGVIKELSLRDKKIRCFVDFREKEYEHEPYISGTYLNPDTIIKTKEDLKKVYDAIDKADMDTNSKNMRFYSVCDFLFADKSLVEEIIDYLNKEGV